MLLLPQAGRVKCLSQSVHSGGRGGTPAAGSWEVAAFTRPGESCGSDTGNPRSLGSEMQIGVCAWPLSALIPQFPRVCSQNVRASSGHTRELRALPRTPILLALAHPFQNAPRHCESLIPRGNAREEKTKITGITGAGRTIDRRRRVTRTSSAPARKLELHLRARVVAERLRSAGAEQGRGWGS